MCAEFVTPRLVADELSRMLKGAKVRLMILHDGEMIVVEATMTRIDHVPDFSRGEFSLRYPLSKSGDPLPDRTLVVMRTRRWAAATIGLKDAKVVCVNPTLCQILDMSMQTVAPAEDVAKAIERRPTSTR